MKVYAHRGASSHAPENTLAAFQLAQEMGADGIELDVQLTRDGAVVVIHDETVDRTTNGTGAVGDLTLADIAELGTSMGSVIYPFWVPPPSPGMADLSGGLVNYPFEVVPSLVDVFKLCEQNSMLINIELKNSVVAYPGLIESVDSLIDAWGFADRVIVSSFNHVSLRKVRELSTDIRTALLFSDGLDQPWVHAQSVGATAIHPHRGYVDMFPEVVAESHRHGIEVNVWTVDDPDDIKNMFILGVDGIFTNYPDRALALRPSV
jgi:glycerophosphoryl diester phosphodiesterase